MARSVLAPWTPDGGAQRAVALEVLINGPLSRAEIARRLGLSAGSLTRLSTPLLESGVLVEAGEQGQQGAGRPSRLLDVVPSSRHFIGMKITAERLIAAVTDFRAGVVADATAPLDSREPEAVVAAVARAAAELAARVPEVTALGIGIGGLVADAGVVRSAPFLGWEAPVELGAAVEGATGLSAVIANDLVAFTEYLHWFGPGRGLDRFATVTLGAGIGYGLMIHGDVIADEDSGLGLVGHWPLDPFGPLCPSGHRGCARSILTQGAITSAVSAALGRETGYEEVLELAASGEPAARRVVDDAGRGLGRLLAAVANLTMPELIVLGGEGVGLVGIAGEAVQQGISMDRDPMASPLVLASTSGDDADWCQGAAAIAIQRYVLGARAGR